MINVIFLSLVNKMTHFQYSSKAWKLSKETPNKHYFDNNKYLMFVVSAPPPQPVTYVTSTQGTVGQSAIGSCSNPLYP